MDKITFKHKQHYTKVFELHGPTSKGVDWGDEDELLFRYKKILSVLQKDFWEPGTTLSLLDVGCGWGGFWAYIKSLKIEHELDYSGIDIVKTMITYASKQFPDRNFIHGDIFDLPKAEQYDFVVCNGILTQKHSNTSIIEMEKFSRNLIKKLFTICKQGIAFNMMSTRVNFMADNLYYQNPIEILAWLLNNISPRVKLDHSYSSLKNGKGKFYDYTVYVYKDNDAMI